MKYKRIYFQCCGENEFDGSLERILTGMLKDSDCLWLLEAKRNLPSNVLERKRWLMAGKDNDPNVLCIKSDLATAWCIKKNESHSNSDIDVLIRYI